MGMEEDAVNNETVLTSEVEDVIAEETFVTVRVWNAFEGVTKCVESNYCGLVVALGDGVFDLLAPEV